MTDEWHHVLFSIDMDEIDTERAVNMTLRRCDEARAAGGISEQARMSGAEVPEGWVLNVLTLYWLPPNVFLF